MLVEVVLFSFHHVLNSFAFHWPLPSELLATFLLQLFLTFSPSPPTSCSPPLFFSIYHSSPVNASNSNSIYVLVFINSVFLHLLNSKFVWHVDELEWNCLQMSMCLSVFTVCLYCDGHVTCVVHFSPAIHPLYTGMDPTSLQP